MLSFSLRGSLISLMAFGFAAFGCASQTDAEENNDSTTQDWSIPNPFGGGGFGIGGGGATGQVVAGPGGLFSTIVNANGSGCPKGTWNASISPDGQTFTVAFSAYQAQVNPGQASDFKDCQLDVAILGTAKLKFDIASFYYQGYVALENPGMRAVQSADYSFNAAGVITGLVGIDIPLGGEVHSQSVTTGPISDSFLNTDNVGGGRWSPCGKANDLHVRTHLQLLNDPSASGQGYVNNSTVDGTLKFGFKMNWQRC
jgi:hypothetical protein